MMGHDVLVGGDDGLAHRSAAAIRVRAGSSPPISSTMTSMLVVGDEVRRRVGQELGGDPAARGRARSRPATPVSTSGAPSSRTVVGPVEQPADHLAADRPRAEDGDAQRGAAHRGTGRVGRVG